MSNDRNNFAKIPDSIPEALKNKVDNDFAVSGNVTAVLNTGGKLYAEKVTYKEKTYEAKRTVTVVDDVAPVIYVNNPFFVFELTP